MAESTKGTTMSSTSRRNGWTLGIVSVALFMVVLDNLVVSVALPTIHRDLGASIQSLEWTVNAYVLAYAVLLLTGAALGDRLGRAQTRPADHSARDPRRRRRRRHAADADAARRSLSGRAARHGDRRLVRRQRHRRRARPARRRRRRAEPLLALDLLDQRADRHRPRSARRSPALREPRPVRQTRPARSRACLDRLVRRRLRPRPPAVAPRDHADDARAP